MKNIKFYSLTFILLIILISCFRAEVRIPTKREKEITRLEEEIKKEMALCNIPLNIPDIFEIEESERGKILIHKDNSIWFKLASYSLDNSDLKIIEDVYEFLKINTNIILIIEGHADERGSNAKDKNQTLSENRSLVVFETLAHLGIDTNKLFSFGYSDKIPRYDTKTYRNRRVEFIVLKCKTDLKIYYDYRYDFYSTN